jgi:hypothetical protein
MWNLSNYGCFVCINEFWMYNYIFLIRKNLVVMGNTNIIVIGNEYASDGQGDMPVTRNILPLTGIVPVTMPVTSKLNRPATGKLF